jgi:predicted permease
MLLALLVILGATAAGVAAEQRWREAAQEAARVALGFLIYALLPFVTFFTVSHVELTAGVGAGLVFAWAELLTVVAVAYLIGTRVLDLPRPSVGALMNASGLANTGYLGVPLIAALIGGSQAIGESITYDLAVSAPMLLITAFAIGAAFGTKAGETAGERVLAFARNPPLLAFVLALIAPEALTPDWARDLAEVLVLLLAPLGFFALGVHLMHEQEDGVRVFPPPLTPAVGVALALRLIAAPGLMLAMSALIVTVPDAFLIQAAMASGINGLAVAHVFGLDLRLAASAIAWSTAIVLTAASVAALVT